MEKDDVPHPLPLDLLVPRGWTVALDDAPVGKGFARVELVPRPLDFAVVQAGKTHGDFELSLRVNHPSVASQPAHPRPCGLLVRLHRFRGSGWEKCTDEEASELSVVTPSASRTLKGTKDMEELMKRMTLNDKASRFVQVNAPGTVKIKFGLTKRLKGVYCVGFRLAYADGTKGDRVALYGPPMTMVANTGKGRSEVLEALKEIIHHVYFTQHSNTQVYDYVFLRQVINAACVALRGMEAFRDDDDLRQARSFLTPEGGDHIDALTDLAWRVACAFGEAPGTGTSKLAQLWSKRDPKLVEGYLSEHASTSEEAKKMLEGLLPGSFVLRLSENCAVGISYVSEEGRVEKMGAKYNPKEKQFTDLKSNEPYPSFGALLRASANKLKNLITYRFILEQPGGVVKKQRWGVPLDHVLQACDDEKTPPLKRPKKQDPLDDYRPVLEACDPRIRERLESLEEENQRLKNELESYRTMLSMPSPYLHCGHSSSLTSAATSPDPSQQPYSYLSSPDAMPFQQDTPDAARGKRAREEEEEEVEDLLNDPTPFPLDELQFLDFGQLEGSEEEEFGKQNDFVENVEL